MRKPKRRRSKADRAHRRTKRKRGQKRSKATRRKARRTKKSMESITKREIRKGSTNLHPLPLPAQVIPQKVTEPKRYVFFNAASHLVSFRCQCLLPLSFSKYYKPSVVSLHAADLYWQPSCRWLCWTFSNTDMKPSRIFWLTLFLLSSFIYTLYYCFTWWEQFKRLDMDITLLLKKICNWHVTLYCHRTQFLYNF